MPYMEFYNSTYKTAKKDHICEVCQRKISVGEKYEYQCGKYDGSFFARHYHIECNNVMQDFWNDVDTDFCYDEVREWWREGFCEECKLNIDNGGNCESDLDRRVWCTKFKRN